MKVALIRALKSQRALFVPIGAGLALAAACAGDATTPADPGATGPGATPTNGPADPSLPPAGDGMAPTTPAPGSSPSDPPAESGRLQAGRLNRVEYNNTVRDLLGSELQPAENFPEDELGYGFDNVGEVLSVGLVHTEQYEKAAASLVDELFGRDAADPVRQRLLPCIPEAGDADACAEQVLKPFMRRAFRRPVQEQDFQRRLELMAKVRAEEASEEEALRLAVKSVLMSPSFLYRLEFGAETPGAAAPVGQFELASRLSYFLWSSMPDDALLDAAEQGELTTDDQLRAQVLRMLQHEHAASLSENFADQWLRTRRLEDHEIDVAKFDGLDEELKQAMRGETLHVFQKLLDENLPIKEFLTADYTFVNPRLADLYGLAPVSDWTEISTANSGRQGLLGHAAFLTLSSTATRTSPTRRGAWVLSELLCAPPPPPPPGVEADLDELAEEGGQTVQEALDQHASKPECAGCHALIDPIGTGLERFDLVGRTREGEMETSGVLPNGATFDGAVELANVLAEDRRFVSCAVGKLLTFAVGRSFESQTDRDWVEHLTTQTLAAGGGLRTTMEDIVLSAPFRMQAADAASGDQP